MNDYDLAIVGGGISGLTAAYEASKSGKCIALIEPNELGGMLQTTVRDGFTLESAAHILTAKESLKKLCDELGLTLEYPKKSVSRQAVFIDGRHVSFKKNPFSMIAAGLVPPSELFRAIKNYFIPPRHLFSVDDMSVAECVRLFAGPKMADNLLKPILRGIYGGFSEKQSAAWLLPSLWKRLSDKRVKGEKASKKGEACRIAGGNHQLPAALQKAIQDKVTVVKDSIIRLRNTEGGLVLVTPSTEITASKVLWTADPDALCDQAFSYVPITVVHFSCSTLPPSLKNHLGVLFAEENCEPLLGIMCYSELFPQTAPERKNLVCMMFGGSEALSWTRENAVHFVKGPLSRHYHFEDLDFLDIHPWRRAIPMYPVDYAEKLQSLISVEKDYPGLVITCRQTSKPGVSDRVESTTHASRYDFL